MKRPHGPQKSLLYRVIAFLSRRQFAFLVRRGRLGRAQISLFVFGAGAIALGIISAVAHVTHLPLVFPPLAASAFILFNTPLAESASPRVVVLSHTLALGMGLFALWFVVLVSPTVDFGAPDSVTWIKIGAIALAMGSVSASMIAWRCVHPPAAATALIAAMGYIDSLEQAAGFLAAVLLLVVEAFLLNRIAGGLPYPLWRWKPDEVIDYRTLAGYEESRRSFWTEIRKRVGKEK